MKDLVVKLGYLLGPTEQRRAILIFFMMAIGALFEAFGIGLLMPFLALLANPESIQEYGSIITLSGWFGVTQPQEMLFFLGVVLMLVYVVKNLYLALMYYTQYGFIYSNLVELTIRLLRVYLHGPYIFHVNRNSADLVRNLSTEVSNVYNRLLLPLFSFIIELLVVCVIGGLLIAIEPMVTLVAVIVLGGLSSVFYMFVRLRVLAYGKLQQRHAGLMIKWINQGVGGIKESKVRRSEDYFIDQFRISSEAYADSVRSVKILQIMPRFMIETLGIGGILSVLVFMMSQGRSLENILPVMGVFGLAAVRLMPSMTRLISALTTIRNSQPSLDLLYKDLRGFEDEAGLKPPTSSGAGGALPFNESIRLADVHYRYPNTEEDTLDGLAVEIKRGESVAFVGSSGSGKTTSIDIILGLLEPRLGQVLVDGEDIQSALDAWQKRIGYIAQPIYLLDDSVRRNVAYGTPDDEIDDARVIEVIAAARLSDHIDSLPDGIETVVGEGGARFSGGQRQRLGIARALYHDPDILILDEATSALDNETEKEIVKTISELSGQRTILTIAHRLSTVRDCDRIYFLRDGQVNDAGTFDELIDRNEAFRQMAQAQRREDGEVPAHDV